MRNALKIASVLAVGALALAGCGSSSSSAPAGNGSSGPTSSIKVGMAYDIGGRGDKSFNDSAARGLDKAKADFGVTTQELSAVAGETDQQKAARLTLLAQGGYNPVIAVGFAYAGAVKTVAAQFPKTNFAIIDDSSNLQPNVANLVFAANQSSYIVGVIAAQASKAASVGFIGGVNVPLLQSFQAGFDAGVKATDSSAKIQDKYLTQPPDFTGFNAPDKGKTVAQGMYDSGADIVFAAAGGSGSGVFAAAKSSGKLAIGVDSDQYLSATPDVQSVILTSALKNVDQAVYDFIKSAVDGKTLTGVQTFDLKNGGVGYSKSNPAVAPYEAKADAAIAAIIAGTVTVPNTIG
ncbi:MAG TPA: BMP family ABC transporter substrate-binding protein [Candidatus Nanopelagicales bacterium]